MISMGTRIRAYNGVLDVLRQGNLGALLVPVVLLLLGWGARASLSRKTVKYSWRGMTLTHPAGWAVAESTVEGGSDSVVLMNLLGPGRIKPRLTLRVATMAPDGANPGAKPDGGEGAATAAPVPPPPTPDGPGAAATGPSGTNPGETQRGLPEAPTSHLPLYYEMAEEPVQVGTYAGTRVDSAFAFTPKAAAGRRRDIPVVMRAIDLVVMRGNEALSAQVAAPIEDFETQRPNLEAIMASLQVDPMPAAAPPVVEALAAPAPPGAVAASGQVVDAQSGLPVPGAIVLFLAPGTSVSDVDDDNLARVAYTTGMADSTGHFTSNRLLARLAHYGVMVVADGYRWIGTDDAVALGDDAPAMLDMGTIPLRRP
jgi:hypothetical protein